MVIIKEKLFMVRIMRMRSQSVPVGIVLCEEVRKKCSQALCGILVYNDETSSVTSKELADKLLIVRSLLRKSLTKDSSLWTKG